MFSPFSRAINTISVFGFSYASDVTSSLTAGLGGSSPEIALLSAPSIPTFTCGLFTASSAFLRVEVTLSSCVITFVGFTTSFLTGSAMRHASSCCSRCASASNSGFAYISPKRSICCCFKALKSRLKSIGSSAFFATLRTVALS